MNISMATAPITTRFLFFILPTSSHILSTSFIMPPKCKDSVDSATPAATPLKRKESLDPASPAGPPVKKPRVPRISAAATTPAKNAPTAKPLVVTNLKAAALKSTAKNPSYSFGSPAPNEQIADTLDYCLHPGVPLHILVHPLAAKLFESVKVYSSLRLYLWI
jgi:hypothetical protein